MVVVIVAASAAFAVAVVFLVGFLLLLLLFVVLVLLLDTLCCDGVLLSTPHFTLTSQSAQRSLIADRAHEHLQGLSPELQDVNPKPSYYALKAIHGLGFWVSGFGFPRCKATTFLWRLSSFSGGPSRSARFFKERSFERSERGAGHLGVRDFVGF